MKNEGKADRIIRVIAAIAFLYLGIVILTGVLKVVAFILAATMLITSAIGFCPLYGVCKINTNTAK
jgi:hypothetical protein